MRLLVFALTFLFALSAYAQVPCGSQPLPQDQAFQMSALPLDDRSVEVRVRVEPCYYLYQNKLSFSISPGKVNAYDKPVGEVFKDKYFGKVPVYRKSFSVIVPFAPKKAGSKVKLRIRYQGCAEAIGLCYAPEVQTIDFIVPRDKMPGEVSYPVKPMFKNYENPLKSAK